MLALAIKLADVDSDNDDAYEQAWDALEHALKEWAAHNQARRNALRRAASLTPERRSEIARWAIKARWGRILASKKAPQIRPRKRRAGGGSSET